MERRCIMARRKFTEKLINKKDINEPMKLINGSLTDYITPSGMIYKDYGDNMFFKKNIHTNKVNGYCYCGITMEDGNNKSHRVHRLIATAFIDNPNNYKVVGHKDNNKSNNSLSNLYWTTVQENTQKAFDDGLAKNKKGFEDSQSIPVCMFNSNCELIKEFGSISECAKNTKYSKHGIIYQCNHEAKNYPRKGYYFRYLDEYKKYGFVL